MGKYRLQSYGEWNEATDEYQNWRIYVAKICKNNELAESNRLKRIELNDKFRSFDRTEGIVNPYEKELEDQA